MDREHVLDELRLLALNMSFEARYRFLHKEPVYEEMAAAHDRDFARKRYARMLWYAAKWAVLAMKARELALGREYPVTSAELRERVGEPDELWIIDVIERWDEVRPQFEENPEALALRVDAFARRLVSWLEENAPA
jgi:hypothetical protein